MNPGRASPATDVLFMLGMLAIGLAVTLRIGLRTGVIAAPANPVVDCHTICALSLIVIATSRRAIPSV